MWAGLFSQVAVAQVVKDLDKDGVKDYVDFDSARQAIVCRLSSQKFVPLRSRSDLTDEPTAGVRATASGFELHVAYMRAGFAHQFRYEAQARKIRLIGMSRYEFGPASNDGSGKSSVNLLTGQYIGEWNRFDTARDKLLQMPVIAARMYFPKIYLEAYSPAYQAEYEQKCSALYRKQRKNYRP